MNPLLARTAAELSAAFGRCASEGDLVYVCEVAGNVARALEIGSVEASLRDSIARLDKVRRGA